MNRRTLMLTVTAALLASPVLAETLDYTPGLIDQQLAAGKTLFVDYTASWCTTCAAQERVMDALRAENPDYDARIVFVDVDWDTYSGDAVTTSRNIPRRSTLLVLKGGDELGRIVAGTSRDTIKDLMDIALAAASN